MPSSDSTTALLGLAMGSPDPSLPADSLAGPWTCLITRSLPVVLSSGCLPWPALDPLWEQWDGPWLAGLCPHSCGIWLLTSHPSGSSQPHCALMLSLPWAICCSASKWQSWSYSQLKSSLLHFNLPFYFLFSMNLENITFLSSFQ